MLRLTFKMNNLDEFIEPSTKPPAPPLGVGEGNIVSEAEQAAYVKDKKAFDETNEIVLAGINLTCAPSPWSHIERITSASEALAKLKELHGTPSFATVEATYKQLRRINSNQFRSLHDYSLKFMELVNELAQMEIPIPAQIQFIIFKDGLPKSMKSYAYAQYGLFQKDKKDVDFTRFFTKWP